MVYSDPETIGIIPARYASSRFPGKPLADIKGKPMIQRVYEQAMKAVRLDRLYVATDDKRIFDAVDSFGGEALMTSPAHPSGTDRCRECLEILEQRGIQAEIILNIQGDEPAMDPKAIDLLASIMRKESVEIATLVYPIRDTEALHNPNLVKAVVADDGHALYFSRSPLPHARGVQPDDWLKHANYFQHLGIYAFRAQSLKEIGHLRPTTLEKTEGLEQLRWLENGFRIQTAISPSPGIGIDQPDDLQKLINKSWES